MMLVASGVVILLSLYTFLLLFAVAGLIRSRQVSLSNEKTNCSFSIIIPFRNEANRLNALLESILQLDYNSSFFEIIFVNDHSTDHSVDLIKSKVSGIPNIQVCDLPLEITGKKQAILEGISKSKFAYILTTDADCKLPKTWLQSYQSTFSDREIDVVIGSVSMLPKNTILGNFQYYDYLAMQAVNVGLSKMYSPILCSGANLGYKKEIIATIRPYQNNQKIASGDDTFLLEAALKNKLRVTTISTPDNLVYTESSPNLAALIKQRQRWLSKLPKSKHKFALYTGSILLLGNIAWLVGFVMSITYANFAPLFIILSLLKFGSEFFVTLFHAKRVDATYNLGIQLVQQVIYPFALFGLTFILFSRGEVYWKNRNITT